jgi:deoxyribonuclease V
MAIRGKADPQWASLVEQWKREQHVLRERMIVAPLATDPLPRIVAGADAAFSDDKKIVLAAAVVYDRIERRIVEVAHATRAIEVPYVPGFLAFREGPAVREAIEKLRHPFEVICFDAHGYAHPRRCGEAAYVSISMDRPGIGVAKSRLIGTFDEPGPRAGDSSPLMDKDEQIGLVLRTRDNPPDLRQPRSPSRPADGGAPGDRVLHEIPHHRADAAGGYRSGEAETSQR